MRAALVVLLLSLLTACAHRSGAEAVPADLAGTVSYAKGSVPPRYHYEWVLRFDATTATVEWTPGYDGTESWRETAPITGDQRARLYQRLRDLGLFDPPPAGDDGMVGGATGDVELTADGRTHRTGVLGESEESARLLRDVVDAVEPLLPARAWRALADKQEDWGAEPK